MNNLEFENLIKEIELLISHIGASSDTDSANIYFESLGAIQMKLAKHSFRDNIKLPAALNKFVRDFDRFDDVELRNRLFSKIEKGEYSIW